MKEEQRRAGKKDLRDLGFPSQNADGSLPILVIADKTARLPEALLDSYPAR